MRSVPPKEQCLIITLRSEKQVAANENENLVSTSGENKRHGVINIKEEVVNEEVVSKEHKKDERLPSEGNIKTP